jgi:hypothetical protein
MLVVGQVGFVFFGGGWADFRSVRWWISLLLGS